MSLLVFTGEDKSPLVGDKKPLAELAAEFPESNPQKQQILSLCEEFPHYRPVSGLMFHP